MSFLFLLICFSLNSILPGDMLARPDDFMFLFTMLPFSKTWLPFLKLQWVPCWQQRCGFHFLVQSPYLCLLIGELGPLVFKSIDYCIFFAICLLMPILCFNKYIYSLCSLLVILISFFQYCFWYFLQYLFGGTWIFLPCLYHGKFFFFHQWWQFCWVVGCHL